MDSTVKGRTFAYRIVVNGQEREPIHAVSQADAFATAKLLYPLAKHQKLEVDPGPPELMEMAELAARTLADRLKPLSVWQRLRVLKVVLGE